MTDIIRSENDSLQKMSHARQALAEARSIEAILQIRDVAEAARHYSKMQGLSLEVVNEAQELKLRADRKLGEALAGMEKNTGTRAKLENFSGGNTPDTAGEDAPPTLAELGITKRRSSEAQQIAALPEEVFEGHIAGVKAAGEELTISGMREKAQEFNYKRDAKTNRKADEYVPQGFDACQTPPYAIDPLLPYLDRDWTIWEPAAGEGLLVGAFFDAWFNVVLSTDLIEGANFFDDIPEHIPWDVIVTNPPFSLTYRWLARCYDLGKPFALLLKVEVLGAKKAQALMQRYGFEIMLLDQRVDFKMPNKGWGGAGAQFPVLWLCWQLLPQQVMFGSIEAGKKAFKHG